MFRILPRDVQARIFSKEAAPYPECITSNDTKADRTLNRSVVIQLEESQLDLDPEDVQTEPLVPEQIPQATTNCTDAERKRLIHAYSVGKAMIQTAMKIVSGMKKGTPEERLLKKYFGKDPSNTGSISRKAFPIRCVNGAGWGRFTTTTAVRKTLTIVNRVPRVSPR